MAVNEFTTQVAIRSTCEHAFDLIADHRNVAPLFEGVSRWEPIGKKATGVGARFRVEIAALGIPIPSTLRLNEWVRPRVIGWVSETGLVKNEGRWAFDPDPVGMRLSLHIKYEAPASVLGAAITRRVDWIVRRRLEHALENIRIWLETGKPPA